MPVETESDLLVVKLPGGVAAAVADLQGAASGRVEHPLRLSSTGRPLRSLGTSACTVEDHEKWRAQTLERKGFRLYTEKDLNADAEDFS